MRSSQTSPTGGPGGTAASGPAPVPARVRVGGDLFHPQVPAGAAYVGRAGPGLRASAYANPHRIGDCRLCSATHDRAAAVTAYAHHLDQRPDLLASARRELSGRDLACWCRPEDRPCHADLLVLIAAGEDPADALRAVLPH